MILFISQYQDNDFKTFAEKFDKKRNNIQTKYIEGNDIFSFSEFSIDFENDKSVTILNDINFDEVKICYINSALSVQENHFSFKNRQDIDYAIQEWNAAALCLFSFNKKTKFLNSYYKKYPVYNEIECILTFQKYGLDTCPMYLTNNSEDFVDIYNFNSNSIIIKRPIQGYQKSKNVDILDLKNLDKLYISPYILQKCEDGFNLVIALINNKYFACIAQTKQQITIPLGVIEKLEKIKKLLNVPVISFYAILNKGVYKFYSYNYSPLYSELYGLFGEKFENELSIFLEKEYNS